MEDVKPDVKPVFHVAPPPSQDEVLTFSGTDQTIWAVKVPRILLDRWSQIKEADVELATMRVDSRYVRGYESFGT